MGKRFKLCILHIGTEKTGSSSIQAFLTQNRQALIKEGKLYLDSGSIGSQWEFVALAHRNPWTMDTGKVLGITDETSRQSFKKTFLENIKQQFHRAEKTSVLLISSEHFHSRLSTVDMIQTLKTILDPFVENYKIISYFRRQDELAVSHLTTRIKSGYQGTDADLPKKNHPGVYYNYAKLITTWAEIFGQDVIQGGLYGPLSKKENGLLKDFCNKCQININGKLLPNWLNPSVSAEGLSFIKGLNNVYKNQSNLLSAKECHDLIQYCSAQNPGKYYPISKSQAKDFYKQYSESNTRLGELLFPDKPKPLFSNDFSQYPDIAETLPDSYEDAVIQAVKIWQKPIPQKGPRALINRIRNYLIKKRE